MTIDRRTAAILAPILVLVALGIPIPAAAQDYYDDIRPVLVQTCMRCHTDDGIGWSMEDAESTYQMRGLIAHMVTTRQMPPWLAEPGVQEYVDDLSLSEDVIAVFAGWRDAGFPRGEPRPDPELAPEPEGAFTADLSLELVPDGSYTPDPSMDDDYRCFLVDWPLDRPGYVTGFRVVPGNDRVAHHTVAYAVEPELVDRFKELEREEDGPGYQCFGDAVPNRVLGPDQRSAYEARYPDGLRELSQGNWWLAHWAPGMWGHVFPEGTGIPLEPGSALAVQMHYYTRDAPGEADAGTRVDFQLAERVERPAFHLAQTRSSWLYGADNGSMVISPGDTVSYELTSGFAGVRARAAELTGIPAERIEALEVHSANLHMHAFGHSGEITLIDPNGRRETLLSVPRWDLHWQRDFTFVEPKIVPSDAMAGTALRVRCTYHHTRDEPVYGGFGSYDEMCFNFSYIAVRESASETVSTESGSPRER